jgi:hypothetical protein
MIGFIVLVSVLVLFNSIERKREHRGKNAVHEVRRQAEAMMRNQHRLRKGRA